MSCSTDKKRMRQVYSFLNKKRKELEKEDPIYIYQSDFLEGTYMIDQPGHYVLKENIVFNPLPDNDYLPKSDNPKYQTLGFSLGFFACIAIFAKDVYLNLNGFSISASPEFALQQRFFSIIELADAPFIPGQGPGNFSSTLQFAENTIIANGTLGLSSHHGIHGNMANNILLENLKIKDFEFVGIALNGGHCLILKDIEIGKNRVDVPVLATYSAARFAKMFAKQILSKYSLSEESKSNLSQKLALLEAEMDQTFSEAISNKNISSDLFRNDTKLPDGNIYGLVIKNEGIAVNDFETIAKNKTVNVFLYKVEIKELECRVDEILAISTKGGSGATNDVAGAVLQIDKITQDGKYKGTVLSDLQLALAKVALELKIPLGKNNISADIISWSEKQEDISTLLKKGYKYKCGGDSMFHFNKGAIGYRFDALSNLRVKKCCLCSLRNHGCLGNYQAIGSYQQSHDQSKRKGYFGGYVTGVNISDCSDVRIEKSIFEKLFANDGDAIGINVIFKSDLQIKKCQISDIKAGTKVGHKWRGRNYYQELVKYKDLEMPNRIPKAIGIRIEKDSLVELSKVAIFDLNSPSKPVKVLRY